MNDDISRAFRGDRVPRTSGDDTFSTISRVFSIFVTRSVKSKPSRFDIIAARIYTDLKQPRIIKLWYIREESCNVSIDVITTCSLYFNSLENDGRDDFVSRRDDSVWRHFRCFPLKFSPRSPKLRVARSTSGSSAASTARSPRVFTNGATSLRRMSIARDWEVFSLCPCDLWVTYTWYDLPSCK